MGFKSFNAIIISAWQQWNLINNVERFYLDVDNYIFNNEFLKRFENQQSMVKLNVSPSAAPVFILSDESLELNLMFNGVPFVFNIPLLAIPALYFPAEKDGVEKRFLLATQSLFDFVNEDISIDDPKKLLKAVPKNQPVGQLVTNDQQPGQVVSMADFKNKRGDKS